MAGIVKDYLQQAHTLDLEAFLIHNPDPFLILQKDVEAVDPRNEYRSTLKLKVDPETKEVRVDPVPPSPLDTVIPVQKSDRNSLVNKILVGRTETNDIVVPHLTVSKHHAFFRFGPDRNRYSVTDTGSTNGTQLNRRPIAPKEARYLADGDQVAFGEVIFTYYTPSGFYDLLRSLSALR